MTQLKLSAKVSAISPELAVAIKVSEIVGKLLSLFLNEGGRHEIFPLKMDINLSSLRTGYHAVIGSYDDTDWPESLRIDKNERLTDKNGKILERMSYAVTKVLSIPRLGIESVRDEAWWELLQAGKEHSGCSYGK